MLSQLNFPFTKLSVGLRTNMLFVSDIRVCLVCFLLNPVCNVDQVWGVFGGGRVGCDLGES